MARNQGRHRIARRTKIATGAIGLAIAVAGIVVTTTTGDPGQAKADEVDKSLFVDITTIQPNVKTPRANGKASKGTFTVNCGKNENGHFNPDNFIAQPGVKNGAEHLHDYVGNLSTNADSNNKSLQAAGTTCKNGDKSAYFWPVVRIDTGEEEAEAAKNPEAEAPVAERAEAAKAAKVPRVECPDVASQLPEDVPEAAAADVEKELQAIDDQNAAADKKLEAAPEKADTGAAEGEVVAPLADQRKASLDKIKEAVAKNGGQAPNMDALAQCAVKDEKKGGIPNGDENSEAPAKPATLPEADDSAELPGNDGEIQRPERVQLTFRGSAVGKVRAMPKFLRVLYGDAKVSTNGPANAKDSWTCSGFEDRLINKYPICPEGSKVKRIHTFPSCWDGKNIDSANHRTHIVFPDAAGRCGKGFRAVPELQITLTYNIPRDIQVNGQYKVDSFPQESHNPFSDHDDFANVMSQCIMNRLVNCVNSGRTCRE
jgi:hypothetical protein